MTDVAVILEEISVVHHQGATTTETIDVALLLLAEAIETVTMAREDTTTDLPDVNMMREDLQDATMVTEVLLLPDVIMIEEMKSLEGRDASMLKVAHLH